MEKPHTGLDECPRILLSCFRARNFGRTPWLQRQQRTCERRVTAMTAAVSAVSSAVAPCRRSRHNNAATITAFGDSRGKERERERERENGANKGRKEDKLRPTYTTAHIDDCCEARQQIRLPPFSTCHSLNPPLERTKSDCRRLRRLSG